MKRNNLKLIVLSIALLLVLLGCNLGRAVSPTPTPDDQVLPSATTGALPTSAVVNTPTEASPPPTENAQPTSSPAAALTDTPAPPTATSGPSCTVLQDLNLRTGPGTAYRPPIRALPAQTILEPLGYNPEGIPDGAWAQVKEPGANQIGWVSAGNQYISCNIDLTSLPSVAVVPPPQPQPPRADNSTPDGTFPPNFVWEADFDSQYLVRFKVYDTNSEETDDGDGIAEVSFQVLDENGDEVYQRTERQAGFCIFGGGEPDCNPWVFEDSTYKWTSGGEAVREVTYTLLIVVTATSGDQGNWNYEVEIDLP